MDLSDAWKPDGTYKRLDEIVQMAMRKKRQFERYIKEAERQAITATVAVKRPRVDYQEIQQYQNERVGQDGGQRITRGERFRAAMVRCQNCGGRGHTLKQ